MHRFNRIFNNPTASPINHTLKKDEAVRWGKKIRLIAHRDMESVKLHRKAQQSSFLNCF